MDPAVTLLLETLKNHIVSTSKKLSGVRDQLEILRENLIACETFLESWTKNPIEDEEQRDSVKKLIEAVYEAEDILADFVAAEETKYKNMPIIRMMAHSFDHAPKLLSVAKKIESMKHNVEEINARKIKQDEQEEQIHDRKGKITQYGEGSDTCPTHPRPELDPILEEEHVVGFDDEAETVIKLLTEGSNDLEVITIVGMPGLGKTTLAKMIFHDSRIQYEFYNRVWVYVSNACNVRELFIQILGNLTKVNSEVHELTTDELSEEVKMNLEREKYLIAMDDVWEPKDWDALQKAFPKNKKSSRILITSRNENVAKHVNSHIEPHKLKFLNHAESFELLNIRALGSGESPHEDLVAPGRKIAKECPGLPLAIVLIGGILREKANEASWWRDVSNNDWSYLAENMEKLIAWSFYQLPHSLKACFLYFGMFPQNSNVSVSKLIRMWIAEGFIQPTPSGNMSMEKIAEEYLEELVSRNLVVVGVLRSNGKIKTCHVHDMLHAFCIKIAAEENLYHKVEQFDPSTYTSSNPEFQKYRRICLYSGVSNYFTSTDSISPHLYTFSCSSSEEIGLDRGHYFNIRKAFKLLRVLDGKPMTFSRFPHDLTRLVHLKYLVLSVKLPFLPGTLLDLWNLQTLVVHTTSHTLDLRGDSFKMSRLRHLETNAPLSWPALSETRNKKEESATNANLTTLSIISPETCTKDAFDRVPNIKKLGIRGKLANILNEKDGSCSFDNLMVLKFVETLKLINDASAIVRLPNGFPPVLKKLTLVNTQLGWSHMSTLGKLQCLEILKLKTNAFKGVLWKPKEGEFPALKVLHIGGTNLVYLEASDCHFPSLQSLSLAHCTYLRELQFSLVNLSSLRKVELFWTTASAVASIKKIYNQTEGKRFKFSIYPRDHDL